MFGKDGTATAYRSTNADGTGRFDNKFVQKPGSFYIKNAYPAGSGTCCYGLHVTSAANAWTHFGVDETAKLWKVTFTRKDLLDCDGEKARLRAGTAEEVPWPFYPKRKKRGA